MNSQQTFSPKNLRFNWLWVVPILLLSTLLVSGQFVADTMWYDEFTTMLFIGGGKLESISLVDVIYRVLVDYAWPPGYYILAWLWEFVIDGSLLGHRLPSLWFGLLSIAVMYRLGKSMFATERAGIVAAALYGFTAILLYQFHEVRGYTLWMFLSALHVWTYWLTLTPKICRRSKAVRWGFVITTALVLYVHYVSLVSVFLLGIHHLLFQRKNPNFLRILKLGINGCVLFAPWVGVFIIGYINKTLVVTGQLEGTYWSSMFAFSNGMPIVLVVIAAYAVWRIRHHPALKMLLFWVVGLYIIVAIGNHWANFVHHPRHIMVVLIPIILLLTYLIEDNWKSAPLIAYSMLLLWIGMGAMNSGRLDFIENMTGQYAIIPAEAMQVTIDIGHACVAPDDRLVLGIWNDKLDTWVHNATMYYHFYDADIQFTLLDRFEPITNFGPAKLDVPFAERIPPFIEGANRIWLFIIMDANYQMQQEIMEDTITDMGYSERDVILATPDITGYIYYTAEDNLVGVHDCVASVIGT
jgi:hypothetical protein